MFSAAFLTHQALLAVSGTVCLFGTWVGMRHFARARATAGAIRFGWLFMASVGTGAALWAATFVSILALDPTAESAFAIGPTACVLLIGIGACLASFEVGSRKRPSLAPEIGGLILGLGILAMHVVALHAWQVAGRIDWSWYSPILMLALALGLSALSVSRANRPVTRYCRHGAAIVMTFTICVMHYALSGTVSVVPDANVAVSADLVPASTLGIGLVCAMALLIGSGFSSYLIDLRTRTESAERIHQLSFNDSMTGLPNRVAFNERLSFAVSEAHEVAHKIAVFAIDLDGFRDINDLYGPSAGDLLLIGLAERLRRLVGPNEFLARQSGDEFLALQTSGQHPHDAAMFAAKIADAVSEPFDVQGHKVTLTASIGHSIFPTDTPERDRIIGNAKLAMLRAKATQRGAICAYQHDMEDAARKKRELARDLTGAAERGEMQLHYQLQTTLAEGAIVGCEALLRWTHPKLGPISPGAFIPLAEGNETIVDIGRWVLRTACGDAAAGRIPGTVAVNLSPVQMMRDDVAALVRQVLLETGLPAARLEIEITESTLMTNQERSLQTLHALKALGVSIAMDDFGTGYSSLATLHAFPFDKIKLDQSFVRRLPADHSAAAIVCTVLALGRSLGVPVLAEGIETLEQWDLLARESCARGQGYLFAKPAPASALPGVIKVAEALASDRAVRAAQATRAAA